MSGAMPQDDLRPANRPTRIRGSRRVRAVAPADAARSAPQVEIPQYGRGTIVGIWAATALPMAALAWLAVPALAARLPGTSGVATGKALMVALRPSSVHGSASTR